jgi:hypothetical protein
MSFAPSRIAAAPQEFRPVPGYPHFSITMSSAGHAPTMSASELGCGCAFASVWSDAKVFQSHQQTQAFCESVGLQTFIPSPSPRVCTVGLVRQDESDPASVYGYVWFHRYVVWPDSLNPAPSLQHFMIMLGMSPQTASGPAVSLGVVHASGGSQVLYQPDTTRPPSQAWRLYGLHWV